MTRLTLPVRVYGPYRGRLIDAISAEVSSLTKNLNITIEKLDKDDTGLVSVEFVGDDDEFLANVLMKEYGTVPKIQDLTIGTPYKGWLVDVGKVGYGIYVDMGIRHPQKVDGLVPLFRIRSQFNMQKTPVRTIANAMLLVDNLPVTVQVTKFDITALTIEVEFCQPLLMRIGEWLSDDHERLIVLGSNGSMIEHSLSKSGHLQDIFAVEQIGRFEYCLVCKRSTRASGIVAAIGPHLRGVPMHLFIPREIGGKAHAET